MKDHIQSGILDDVPAHSRYLSFSIDADENLASALKKLALFADGEKIVVGIGKPIADALKKSIPGLIDFPHFPDTQIEIPTTQKALWCWLRGSDRGDLLHTSRAVIELLDDALVCDSIIDGFRYDILLDGTQ